ncbi:MAG: hypothetical protein JWM91_4485, partial [Rhodospirillales bacterium]|nr:hypothetical protein [Rhodospirillales bacterium]
MLEELKFYRQIEHDDEPPEVETLTVSEESGRVRICIDTEGLGCRGTYRLSWKEEA